MLTYSLVNQIQLRLSELTKAIVNKAEISLSLRQQPTSKMLGFLCGDAWFTSFISVSAIPCASIPPAPVNGYIVRQNGSVYTSEVAYKCNEGYYLVDVRGEEYTIQCEATGLWSSAAPKCDMCKLFCIGPCTHPSQLKPRIIFSEHRSNLHIFA